MAITDLTSAAQKAALRDLPAGEAPDPRLHQAALLVTLDQIPTAAYLIDVTGAVHLSNEAGQRALEAELVCSDELGACVKAGAPDPRFTVTPLEPFGCAGFFLVVEKPTSSDPSVFIPEAARRWRLTPREADVLACLARGASNKEIALSLGCALRTIEVHVTRILEKARARSRTALIAQFWMDATARVPPVAA